MSETLERRIAQSEYQILEAERGLELYRKSNWKSQAQRQEDRIWAARSELNALRRVLDAT
jgi:hypothetical protein